MKLLTIRFQKTVDTSLLPPGTEVTVSDKTTTISGKVISATIMEDPPTLEGNYHIKQIPA